MWCVARFGTICTTLKTYKTPVEEFLLVKLQDVACNFTKSKSFMGVLHVFKIVWMVPSCAEHLIYWLLNKILPTIFLYLLLQILKESFHKAIAAILRRLSIGPAAITDNLYSQFSDFPFASSFSIPYLHLWGSNKSQMRHALDNIWNFKDDLIFLWVGEWFTPGFL